MSSVDQILEAISRDDIQSIKSHLDKLPLGLLSKDRSDEILLGYVIEAMENSRKKCLRVILDIFDAERVSVDPLPTVTNLFNNPLMEREHLLFAVSCYPDKIPFDFYIDISNMDDDALSHSIALRVLDVLPNLSHEEWTKLSTRTDDIDGDEYQNPSLRELFISKIQEQHPKWVKEGICQTLESVPEMPTVKYAVDTLMDNLHKLGINPQSEHDIPQVRETLITQYAMGSIIEKTQMLLQFVSVPIFDDTAIFMEHGPVNTIYSDSVPSFQYECTKYGGCRMLLCTEFEQQYPDSDEIDIMTDFDLIKPQHWFTGTCQACTRYIKHEHYAIRKPLQHGGWRGCFCSFECLETSIDNEHSAVMIDRMSEQMHEIGIRDR